MFDEEMTSVHSSRSLKRESRARRLSLGHTCFWLAVCLSLCHCFIFVILFFPSTSPMFFCISTSYVFAKSVVTVRPTSTEKYCLNVLLVISKSVSTHSKLKIAGTRESILDRCQQHMATLLTAKKLIKA